VSEGSHFPAGDSTDLPAQEVLPPEPHVEIIPSVSSANSFGENPVWTGWDVLRIALVTLGTIFFSILGLTFAAQKLLFPNLSFTDIGKMPLLSVAAQGIAYTIVLIYMIVLVVAVYHQNFESAVRWNWPRRWPVFLLGGAVLALALQGFAHFLPIPTDMPIDEFFTTSAEAWALTIFGITLAPLIEELFFRGFLYPVLARRLGVFLAIILTAAGFGLIHGPQLGRAWGPVLVIFLVGIALTVTRAITKSVAAGILIHIGYNSTLSALLFWASDGFRHLERLRT
jgi:membrane protease YdiL (CAAX protease family)